MPHVWADVLGNLQENALPHCQLLCLSDLIRTLPEESSDIILFCMDIICVPPDGTGQNEAQDLAMQFMQQTYENAAAVLVLDSWLLKSPGSGRSDAENLMRIFLFAMEQQTLDVSGRFSCEATILPIREPRI